MLRPGASAVLLLFLCIAQSPMAAEQEEKPEAAVRIRGRIAIVGNEPFTRFVLRGDDGKIYELSGVESDGLYFYQNLAVEVEGTLIDGNQLEVDNIGSETEPVKELPTRPPSS